MSMFDAFYMLCAIAFIVQIGSWTTDGLSKSSSILESNYNNVDSGIIIAFIILMSAFYVAAIYFSFQTYKEFKALYQEKMGYGSSSSSS